MSDQTPSEFADLMARAGRGDEDALAELSRQYEPKVRVVARVLLGPALRPYLDSVDLVQSVHKSLMLGLRRNQYDISDPDKLVALTLTMLRRKAARHWRRLQRQQRLSGAAAADSSTLADVLTSLSSSGSDPARDAEFRDQVRHVCRHLDETERRILELRSQDYTTAEVAEQVGISPVALRVRMTRLRQRLAAAGVVTDWL
jgi:RNA polymerase sigma factor (sigma-70 family)